MYEHVEILVERKDCEEDVAGLQPIIVALPQVNFLVNCSIVECLETRIMRHIVSAWIKVCFRNNIHQNVS